MKKWHLELIIFLLVYFLVWFLTGLGGAIGGLIIGGPAAMISGWIWDKCYANYRCESCKFTSATKEEMQEHIKKKHKNNVEGVIKYSKIKKE